MALWRSVVCISLHVLLDREVRRFLTVLCPFSEQWAFSRPYLSRPVNFSCTNPIRRAEQVIPGLTINELVTTTIGAVPSGRSDTAPTRPQREVGTRNEPRSSTSQPGESIDGPRQLSAPSHVTAGQLECPQTWPHAAAIKLSGASAGCRSSHQALPLQTLPDPLKVSHFMQHFWVFSRSAQAKEAGLLTPWLRNLARANEAISLNYGVGRGLTRYRSRARVRDRHYPDGFSFFCNAHSFA